MFIDLHCHTKKCKQGDASTRNVTRDLFIKKINNANVGAVAITNHNTFDFEQFKELQNDSFMVWPGCELDVIGKSGERGHCIIIVSPNEARTFDEEIRKLTNGSSPRVVTPT